MCTNSSLTSRIILIPPHLIDLCANNECFDDCSRAIYSFRAIYITWSRGMGVKIPQSSMMITWKRLLHYVTTTTMMDFQIVQISSLFAGTHIQFHPIPLEIGCQPLGPETMATRCRSGIITVLGNMAPAPWSAAVRTKVPALTTWTSWCFTPSPEMLRRKAVRSHSPGSPMTVFNHFLGQKIDRKFWNTTSLPGQHVPELASQGSDGTENAGAFVQPRQGPWFFAEILLTVRARTFKVTI